MQLSHPLLKLGLALGLKEVLRLPNRPPLRPAPAKAAPAMRPLPRRAAPPKAPRAAVEPVKVRS